MFRFSPQCNHVSAMGLHDVKENKRAKSWGELYTVSLSTQTGQLVVVVLDKTVFSGPLLAPFKSQ